MTVDPAWQWWADKLAGKLPPGAVLDHPQAGFYRKSSKERYGARKTFTPVAYWPDEEGFLHCREGDEDVDAVRAMELWNTVNHHPVSEQAYRDVAQHGKLWPDEHELVPMQKPGLGHNRGPDWNWDEIEVIRPDDAEMLAAFKDRLENLGREGAKRVEGPPIADQDEADRIANLADALAQLHKIADTSRKAEKRPYDEAAERIQKKWLPLLGLADAYKNLKYKLITPWLKLQEEEQKKQAAAAVAVGEAPSTRRPRAGTRGRAMSLKPLKTARITDYDACLAFFKENEELKACVQLLASRAIRAGITVPGAVVEEESKAV